MAENKFNTKFQLKKFKKHFILSISLIILVVLILAFMASSPKEAEVKKKKTASETFSAVKPLSATALDVTLQKLQEYKDEQQKVNEQNSRKLAELESENIYYRKAAEEAESKAAVINQKLSTIDTVKAGSSAPVIAIKPQKLIFEDDINSDNSDADSTYLKQTASAAIERSGRLEKSSHSSGDKSISTYIPSNTFVKGILVGSLSANTGGSASSDPTPVLIRLTDLAQLPNEFRSNLKSCMVGGSGWGDLSTERVKIRLTTLSCVLKSGKAIDIPVEGYINGEDSKAGIAGLVVTHSGALTAKATLAGFIQGLGQIGQALGQTQTITPLGGVTTTISPNEAITAGAGAGISQAGSTLSQYYLSMLQQISPAIEVAAGRHITVIFIKGIELKLPINEQDDEESIPLPIS